MLKATLKFIIKSVASHSQDIVADFGTVTPVEVIILGNSINNLVNRDSLMG